MSNSASSTLWANRFWTDGNCGGVQLNARQLRAQFGEVPADFEAFGQHFNVSKLTT